MVQYIDFVGGLHTATSRNYLERVVAHDKAECAEVACRFGAEYWDGDRRFGYGGYRYDGRWYKVAEAMARHYGIKPGHRILDVGCGKGFLIHEFTRAVPGVEVFGIDISEYGVRHAKPEVSSRVIVGHAGQLPFPDDYFHFVVSITTLHNLGARDLHAAIGEIERVGIGDKHITIESYRSQREKANLLYWQLTCKAFHDVADWQWVLQSAGYTGDYGAIFFE